MIKILQGHNQDEDIIVTWEGIFRDIEEDNIYLAANGKVIIDADENCYKGRIQRGERVYIR